MRRLPRLRYLLAALSVCLFAASLGAEEEKTRPFVDPAGYRLSVPEAWRINDRTKADALIRADLVKGETAGVQVRLQRCPENGFDQLVEKAIASYREEMSGHWGGTCEVTAREPVKVADEGLTVRFRLERGDGSTWYLQESFVRSGTTLVVLQGGCLWDARTEIAPALDRIVASIRFDDPAPAK